MDHEIQNDVDVQAARRKGPQAVDLDESGPPALSQEEIGGRVEALHVPDLEDPLSTVRARDEIVGLLESRRDRFLDQDILVRIQTSGRDCMVRQRGDRD